MTHTQEPFIASRLEDALARMSTNRGPIGVSPADERNTRIVSDWLDWLESNGNRQPLTVRGYAGVLASFLVGPASGVPLDEVSVEAIEGWLLRPRGRRGGGEVGAPATRARNIAVLRSCYGWLMARGLVGSDPTVLLVAPTVHNKTPKAIPDRVLIEVMQSAAGNAPLLGVLVLGAFVGLRRAEIVAIRAEHLDPDLELLSGFIRKGGGDDTFPLAQVLRVWQERAPHLWAAVPDGGPEAVLRQLRASDGVLLERPDHVNRLLRDHLEAVGMPRAFTPHALRHSFVTNLLKVGMPIHLVSELANHSDLSVTMRYAKLGGGAVSDWLASC